MRFKAGIVIGFGAGYYLGARAGRERYIQINAMLRKLRRSDAYEAATEKAQAAVDLTVERTKGFVEDHLPTNGHPTPEPYPSSR